jgi:hypothetical protein
VPWSTPFDDPIELPDGRALRTLGDAGHYIAELPKATQQRPEWQRAAKTLVRAAEGRGLLMFGMMPALHAGKAEPPTTPRRKRTKLYRIVR